MPTFLGLTKKQFYIQSIMLLMLLFSIHSLAQKTLPSSTRDVLSFSLEELLNIKVTTSAKKAQKTSTAPSIINVITAEEIVRMGAKSLNQVLSILPGFTPLTELTSDRLFVVRGLSLKDGILVLIDGVTVNDAFDGSFDFYQRQVDDIDRIEIIRGPGSALYGGYAVSAVIHIFTKPANVKESLHSLKLGLGSFQEKRFSAGIKQDLSSYINNLKVSSNFSYTKSDGDKLYVAQDGFFTPTQGDFLAPLSNPTLTPTIRQESVEKFNGHINADINNLSINFNHGQLISTPIFSHLGLVTEIDKSIKETTLDVLSAAYRFTLFDKVSVAAKVYGVLNEAKLFGQSMPPHIRGDEDQDGLNENFFSGIIENFHHRTKSLGTEIESNYTLNAEHELLIGLIYDKTDLVKVEKIANVTLFSRGEAAIFPAQNVTHEFMPENVNRVMKAVYVQEHWSFNEKLNITAGIRVGEYSDFGKTTNPRIGVVHKFNEQFYMKLLYGEAFKPPTFSQLFDLTPTLNQFRKRGNSTLKPTEISTIEWQLGYDFSPRLKSNITVFQNDTSNEIFFDSQSDTERWRNLGARKTKGVEIELKGAWLGFDFSFFNYSYQKTTEDIFGLGENIHPNHRINSGGIYQITDNFQLNVNLSYFSSPKREADDKRTRISAKFLTRLTLQARNVFQSKLDAELAINNVFNSDYRDEIRQSAKILDDIPLEKRTVQLTLSYQF